MIQLEAADYPSKGDGWVRRTGVVDSVYDGDTIRVTLLDRTSPLLVVTYGPTPVRLAHIDAPEVRTRDLVEKSAGLAARDRLRELAPVGSLAILHDFGTEKYGRILAQVNVNGVNVSEVLLAEGHVIHAHLDL